MANVNKIDGTGGSAQKPSLQQLVDKGLSEIFKRVQLPADQDRRSLGAGAKTLVSDIEAQLKKAGGSLPDGTIKGLVDRLAAALNADKLKALNLGAPPTGADAAIPATGDILRQSKDGSFSLVGPVASPSHGLTKLLQKLGLDPQKLDPKLAERVEDTVRDRKFNLSSPGDFNKLALALSEGSGRTGKTATPPPPPTVEDRVKSLNLGAAPTGAAAALPVGGALLAKNADGTFKLNSSAGSGIGDLLKKLGFDPQALPGNAADRLSTLTSAKGFSISDQKSFEKLGLTLAEVSPLHGAPKTNGTSSASSTASPVRQGAASAPTETGKGTTGNALNALIANKLSGSDAKGGADALKKSAVDELIKSAGVDTVKPEIRADVEKMLDKVMTDPANPTAPNAGRILQNAFVELSRATGDREWMKGAAFATQLQAAVDKVPVDQRGALEQNLAVMAVPLMEAAAQAKISKATGGAVKLDAKPSTDAMSALSAMLGARGIDVGTLDTDKILRESRAADGAAKTGKVDDKAAGKFDPKAIASDFILKDLKCDPKDPDVAKGISGIETLLKRAGSMDPAAVTQAAYDIFKEKTGMDHPYAAHAQQMLLDPQQAEQWRSQLMLKAAQAATDPQFFAKAKAEAEQLQAQLAAAGGAGGPGGPGGPMGPGGLSGGVPGFTGPGMPTDANNPLRQMEMGARQFAIGSIIHDPALTMEDKLFLIMMYLGMFANEDLLKKAEELAALDRSEEQRADMTRRAQTSLQNETQTRAASKKAADEAAAKFQTLSSQPGATPDAKEAAKKEMEATGNAFKRSQERERALQNDLNTLKGPSNQPKSREALTMELRRMEDMKRLFADTLQALMQSFKESTRNVIQGMNR